MLTWFKLTWLKIRLRYMSDQKGKSAAVLLGQLGDPRAVKPLMAALKNGTSGLQAAAAEALVKLGSPSVNSLIAALQDDKADMREKAARLLAEIGDSRAVKPLIAAVKDRYTTVQVAAARALGKLSDPCAVQPLMALLKERVIGGTKADKVAIRKMREAAAEALIPLGNPSVLPLIEALKDSDEDVRQLAARALGELGDARAVEPLIESDSNQASKSLIKLGSLSVKPLISSLQNSAKEVRLRAIYLLGEIGVAEAVEPLIAGLKNSDVEVRETTAWALGKLHDSRAVEPLIAALKVVIRRLREADAKGLAPGGFIPNETDRLRKLRKAATQSLVELADALGQIGDSSARLELSAALKDTDWGVRWAAAEALQALKAVPTDATERAFFAIVRSDVEACAREGKAAVEPLIAALLVERIFSPFAFLHKAAEALGKLGDPRAVEPLLNVLQMRRDDLCDVSLKNTVRSVLLKLLEDTATDLPADLLRAIVDLPHKLDWPVIERHLRHMG